MVFLDAYLKGLAAAVTITFALVVWLGGPRRAANVYLALFLLAIGGNQTAEALNVGVTDPTLHENLTRAAAVFAALDPFMLFAFAGVYPEPDRLRKGWVLASIGGTSALFALAAGFGPSFGPDPSPTYTVLLSSFTVLVYSAVLVEAIRAFERSPEERVRRALVAAASIATLIPWFRIAPAMMAAVGIPYEAPFFAARLVVGWVVFALGALWLVRRLGPAHRRLAWLTVAAASFLVVVQSLAEATGLLGMIVRGRPYTPTDVAGDLGRASTAVRWLLFGALVSTATVRDRMLDMSLAARRRTARVLIGLAFLTGAVLVLVLVQPLTGKLDLPPLEAAVILGVVVLSQGFRALIDRVAALLYGVPMPGDIAGRHEAYRMAAAQAAGEGRPLARDLDLQRLREELGIDMPTATVLERLAEERSGGPLVVGHTLLGRYRVLQSIGRGGSGRIFLARDETLQREVVLKEVLDEGDKEPVLREARAAGSIQHPNVLTLHDVLRRPGASILVTEHAQGGSLDDRLAREGPLSEKEGRAILEGVLSGVAAVHARGIVHGDIKTSNVLLTPQGPKVADFGIARVHQGATVDLAMPGRFVGTPGVMAPEQRRGEPTTPATDVYALGLLMRATLGPLPEKLAAIAERATMDVPEERYHDAGEMLSALRSA